MLSNSNNGTQFEHSDYRSKSYLESTKRTKSSYAHIPKREFIEAQKGGKNIEELKEIRDKPIISKMSNEMASVRNSGIPIYKRFYQEIQVKENRIQE